MPAATRKPAVPAMHCRKLDLPIIPGRYTFRAYVTDPSDTTRIGVVASEPYEYGAWPGYEANYTVNGEMVEVTREVFRSAGYIEWSRRQERLRLAYQDRLRSVLLWKDGKRHDGRGREAFIRPDRTTRTLEDGREIVYPDYKARDVQFIDGTPIRIIATAHNLDRNAKAATNDEWAVITGKEAMKLMPFLVGPSAAAHLPTTLGPRHIVLWKRGSADFVLGRMPSSITTVQISDDGLVAICFGSQGTYLVDSPCA